MPDPITWYLLPRLSTDLQSIMEAIDAKLLTHNEDPSAHGQAGEVVETHRVETELDHPLQSMDLRYLAANKVFMFSSLESTDGWTKVGTFNPYIFAANLMTTNVLNNVSYAFIDSPLAGFLFDPSKDSFFQTSVFFSDNTSQLGYFGVGDIQGVSEEEGYGFKVLNGTLYACIRSGPFEFLTEIAGITITDLNVYRAEWDCTAQALTFYVNGVLKHTETTNIPNSGSETFFEYYIKTTTTVIRKIRIADILFEQDR